jgi:hypothetical protein
MYGLDLKPAVAQGVFNSIDVNGNGVIQIHEFMDNLMGRWSAEANSIQAIGAREEELLRKIAEENATLKLKQTTPMESIRMELKFEEAKRLHGQQARKKRVRVPIWKRSLPHAKIGALPESGSQVEPRQGHVVVAVTCNQSAA